MLVAKQHFYQRDGTSVEYLTKKHLSLVLMFLDEGSCIRALDTGLNSRIRAHV